MTDRLTEFEYRFLAKECEGLEWRDIVPVSESCYAGGFIDAGGALTEKGRKYVKSYEKAWNIGNKK